MGRYMALMIITFTLLSIGCDEFGQVDQGRVIAYDKNKNTLVMIRDNSPDPRKPVYKGLPPVSYKLPSDARETGPEPRAGKLLNLDPEKREIDIFIETSNNIITINYTPVDQKKVDPEDQLVYDQATQKNREFPNINRENKTITVYMEKKQTLLTFSVPDQYFILPPDTWAMGDEVRMYYKEPGKSLRFMNISKTDIFKK